MAERAVGGCDVIQGPPPAAAPVLVGLAARDRNQSKRSSCISEAAGSGVGGRVSPACHPRPAPRCASQLVSPPTPTPLPRVPICMHLPCSSTPTAPTTPTHQLTNSPTPTPSPRCNLCSATPPCFTYGSGSVVNTASPPESTASPSPSQSTPLPATAAESAAAPLPLTRKELYRMSYEALIDQVGSAGTSWGHGGVW